MNQLQKLLKQKSRNLLSLFFTAGYPRLDSTGEIITAAEQAGIDFLEVGMPYSDPLADGPVIQESSTRAIANGMNLELLFSQLQSVRDKVQIPLVLMGYLNPVMQFGVEKFVEQARLAGVSGLILPDLPLYEYQQEYETLFRAYGLSFIFLISPQTSEERIRLIDSHSDSFIYVVSTAATTGRQQGFGQQQQSYFRRLQNMGLQNKLIGGFGIHDRQTLQHTWQHLDGAICGSAFLKKLAVQPQPQPAIELLRQDLGW